MTEYRLKEARQLARAGGVGKAGAVLAMSGLLTAGPGALADEVYHPAQSPAEIALKRFMDIEAKDGDWIDDLLGRGPNSAAYRANMSPALFSDMARRHRAELQRNCHGKTHGDGYCSWDVDPIQCTDAGGEPQFRTLRQEKATAVVGYTWGIYTSDEAQYRMVRINGAWRLDGINCVNDRLKFNWK